MTRINYSNRLLKTSGIFALAAVLLMGLSAPNMSFAAIASTSGDVQEISAPANVGQGFSEEDTDIQIFQEKENHELTVNVDVDNTADGSFGNGNEGVTPGTLIAGTFVNSYLIHIDLVGDSPGCCTSFDGSVTFDNDIIGVIIFRDSLAASDGELGHDSTTYPGAQTNRGLDWTLTDDDDFTIAGNVFTIDKFDVGNWADDVRVITQGEEPNEDPDCSAATPSKAILWPPNHKFVSILIDGVTDPEGDAITLTIDGITQDEPVNAQGNGDGNTSPDGVIDGETVDVRAERAGTGDGRVYEILFTADDGNGGSCTGSVAVGVPHDKKDTPVDSGQIYDSTLE